MRHPCIKSTLTHCGDIGIAPGYFPSEMTMKESDERNKTSMPDEKVKDKG
jgi:hypothetical protein